jgi:uncharacterized repeat protein (TIGR03803 family)
VLLTIALSFSTQTLFAQVPVEVLHTFTGGTSPAAPYAGLILSPDGNLYGTSSAGGTSNRGTVFRVTPAGALTVLHSFSGEADGSMPIGGLVLANDGNIYGTTSDSHQPLSLGAVFRLTPNGVFTIATDIPPANSGRSYASLIQASNGLIYGTGAGPIAAASTVFGAVFSVALTPTGTTSVRFSHRFGDPGNPPMSGGLDGTNPLAALVEGSDGNLYGTTQLGGSFGLGTIFRMAPNGAVTILHPFAGGQDGAYPYAALIQASDGNFYGTTSQGGICDCGTLFRMTPAGDITLLHAFNGGTDGAYPVAALTQGSDGDFYGTTSQGGLLNRGTIFRMTPSGVLTTLHAFDDGEGRAPMAPLLEVGDGTFYGTTLAGGQLDLGTIFTVNRTGDTRVLVMFETDGAVPLAGLVRGNDGALYGTTVSGGLFGLGSFFRLAASGALSVLHGFAGWPDGLQPAAAVLQGRDGNFYGTTTAGGSNFNGAAFSVTATGALTVVHSFAGMSDGYSPLARLLQTTDGNLYGTTMYGGAFNHGTVFRITPDGVFSSLYMFTGGLDGGYPTAGLVQASDGQLYGTTSFNGRFNAGTAFRISLDGTLTTLHAFAGGRDGAYPMAALAPGPSGSLYGTTYGGGSLGNGTIFSMTRDGRVTVLHAFGDGADDAALPMSAPILGSDGNLYGLSSSGGAAGCGTLFQITLGGVITVLHVFHGGAADGCGPVGELVQNPDGRLVGLTMGGGPADAGVAFRLNPFSAPIAPVEVNIVNAAGGVRVSWSAVQGATSYTVKRAGVPTAESVVTAGLTATSITDTTTIAGHRYYYIVTAVNAFGESVRSYEVSITAGRATRGDFDGDGKTDVAVYRPVGGQWHILQSTSMFQADASYQWGLSTDVPVPADYDGDGRADIAIYRPSTGEWYVLLSTSHFTTYTTYRWGITGDQPVIGDFDGDGRTDLAVYRPSTGFWYVRTSSTGYSYDHWTGYQWGGLNGDVPVAADLDGDGRTDLVVFRPATGEWLVRFSASAYSYDTWASYQWGQDGDVPLVADIDGDGRSDLVVYRPATGTWNVRASSNGYSVAQATSYEWGLPTDIPLSADLDGDGRTDLTVYRPATGEWFVRLSSMNYNFDVWTSYQWGVSTDTPLPPP